MSKLKTSIIGLFFILFSNSFSLSALEFTSNEKGQILAYLQFAINDLPKKSSFDWDMKIESDLDKFLADNTKTMSSLLHQLGEKDHLSQIVHQSKQNKANRVQKRLQLIAQELIQPYMNSLDRRFELAGQKASKALSIIETYAQIVDHFATEMNSTETSWYLIFSNLKEDITRLRDYADSMEWSDNSFTNLFSFKKVQEIDNAPTISRQKPEASRPQINQTTFHQLKKQLRKLPPGLVKNIKVSDLFFDFIPVEAKNYKALDFSRRSFDQTVEEDFEMMKYEVTQILYTVIMGKHPLYWTHDHHPMNNIGLNHALKFVETVNEILDDGYQYFLPSDAQWGLAVRKGAKGDALFYGNRPEKYIWASKSYSSRINSPTTVNSPKIWPNPGGFHHLLGNIKEWVWRDLSKTPSNTNFHFIETTMMDGSSMQHKLFNPKKNNKIFFLRGGDFNGFVSIINYASYFPGGYSPSSSESSTGLRLVRKRLKQGIDDQ